MAQSASAYLRLPRELRDQIHGYLTSLDLLSLRKTCRITHIEVIPLLQTTYVLEIRKDIDQSTRIERLKCMPASTREWLRRATWYMSSTDGTHMVRDISHRRETWELMRSRLCLTELTVVFELPGTQFLIRHGRWIHDRTLQTVLCDRAIASRKRLILSYGPRPQVLVYPRVIGDPMALWVDTCGTLSRTMEADASIESLELWIPRDVIEQQPIEYAEVTSMNSEQHWLSPKIEWHKPSRILPFKQIKGLKDLRLKLYDASEPLSQQSRPLEPLPVEGLEAFLRQQMGIPEPYSISRG